MKKLVLMAAVLFSAAMVSCGGSDAAQAAADSLQKAADKATEQIQNAANDAVNGAAGQNAE